MADTVKMTVADCHAVYVVGEQRSGGWTVDLPTDPAEQRERAGWVVRDSVKLSARRKPLGERGTGRILTRDAVILDFDGTLCDVRRLGRIMHLDGGHTVVGTAASDELAGGVAAFRRRLQSGSDGRGGQRQSRAAAGNVSGTLEQRCTV